MEWFLDLGRYIGEFLLAAIVVAPFIYWFAQRWLERWIQHRFDRQLEEYRQKSLEALEALRRDNAKELEHYKFETNKLLRRVSMIQDKEFDILPIAWQKSQEVASKLTLLCSSPEEVPDLDRMSSPRLREFFEGSKLSQSEQDAVRRAQDRTAAYLRCVWAYDLSEAAQKARDFRDFLSSNEIFLSNELYTLYREVDLDLEEVLHDFQASQQRGDASLQEEACKKLEQKVKPILRRVSESVQQRLHYHQVD